MQAKSIFTSKTFILASIQALIGIALIFGNAYPDAGWIMIGKSVLDVILRTVTDTPVTL